MFDQLLCGQIFIANIFMENKYGDNRRDCKGT